MLVVGHIDLGRLGWSNIVAGAYLIKVLEDGRRLPNFVIKVSVDDRRSADLGNRDILHLRRWQNDLPRRSVCRRRRC